jgi:hypothetical protein
MSKRIQPVVAKSIWQSSTVWWGIAGGLLPFMLAIYYLVKVYEDYGVIKPTDVLGAVIGLIGGSTTTTGVFKSRLNANNSIVSTKGADGENGGLSYETALKQAELFNQNLYKDNLANEPNIILSNNLANETNLDYKEEVHVEDSFNDYGSLKPTIAYADDEY